jgi:hypothetical protein
LNLALIEDPLLAQASAANSSMPLTPPADEPTFQPLDASFKLPDTPMTAQFSDEDVESIFAEPEGDVEKAHLVTHAKVYAIAEKYVLPHLSFSSLGLRHRMHKRQPFLIRAHVCLRRDLNPVALRCVAYHGGKAPTSSVIRVTPLLVTSFPSTLSIGCNPPFVFFACVWETPRILVSLLQSNHHIYSLYYPELTMIPDTRLQA